MDKEEILRKAQNEQDEMEQAVLTKSMGFSTIIIPALSIIFIIIRILHSEYIISDLVSITLAQICISEIYHAIKMKKRWILIIGILTLIITFFFIIEFINEVKI